MKLSERMFARAERMRKRGRRAYAMFLRRDAKKVAQLEAYCDKLAAGFPDGMLPKDVEVLRKANHDFAAESAELKRENEALRELIERELNPVVEIDALLTAEEDNPHGLIDWRTPVEGKPE